MLVIISSLLKKKKKRQLIPVISYSSNYFFKKLVLFTKQTFVTADTIWQLWSNSSQVDEESSS